MIRYAKHNNQDFIVVDSTIQIDNQIIPIQVQVHIQNVKEVDRHKVYRITNSAFNRNISFDVPKTKPKKPWWKIF